MREEAEGALRRDATRAALGGGFGAAFGLPRKAGDELAGAGANAEDSASVDEGDAGTMEVATDATRDVTDVVVSSTSFLSLLLLSHSGDHRPFCATGVA